MGIGATVGNVNRRFKEITTRNTISIKVMICHMQKAALMNKGLSICRE
jgi:hypothetical protein